MNYENAEKAERDREEERGCEVAWEVVCDTARSVGCAKQIEMLRTMI